MQHKNYVDGIHFDWLWWKKSISKLKVAEKGTVFVIAF